MSRSSAGARRRSVRRSVHPTAGTVVGAALGAGSVLGARVLLRRGLRRRLADGAEKLSSGDPSSLLAGYARDAVLHFQDGEHRWGGSWSGPTELDRFFRELTAAGVRMTVRDVVTSGPPWALTIWARVDDHADAADGTRLYENRIVTVVRTRWGKIVEQEDFFVDTDRISRFDRALTARGVEPGLRAPRTPTG